jgi:hypothetical protein
MKKKKIKISRLIERIDDLLLEKLKTERGSRCQICGKTMQLGLFHVIPKGSHPRLRFTERNLLIVGWFCCHLPFHHDYYIARDRIIPRIKELLGENYEEELLTLETTLPRMDRILLEELLVTLEE